MNEAQGLASLLQTYGAIGGLVISLWFNWWLLRLLIDSYRHRVTEANANGKQTSELTEAIRTVNAVVLQHASSVTAKNVLVRARLDEGS